MLLAAINCPSIVFRPIRSLLSSFLSRSSVPRAPGTPLKRPTTNHPRSEVRPPQDRLNARATLSEKMVSPQQQCKLTPTNLAGIELSGWRISRGMYLDVERNGLCATGWRYVCTDTLEACSLFENRPTGNTSPAIAGFR